jgi:hypothetical protein
VIHEALEGGRTIAHAEEHDSWFKESVVCFKGSLPLVFFSDLNVVVSPLDVEFTE